MNRAPDGGGWNSGSRRGSARSLELIGASLQQASLRGRNGVEQHGQAARSGDEQADELAVEGLAIGHVRESDRVLRTEQLALEHAAADLDLPGLLDVGALEDLRRVRTFSEDPKSPL